MTASFFLIARSYRNPGEWTSLPAVNSLWSRYPTHAVWKQITCTLIYPIHISFLAPSPPGQGAAIEPRPEVPLLSL